MRFYQYSEGNWSRHFDSCPVMIWLTKQMNILPNESVKGVLWNSWAEKSRNIPRKMSLIKPCFNNIIAFPRIEQLFCREHAIISFSSLDAFLVFNREASLCSFSEPATHRSTKEQLLRNFPEKKTFIGNVSFWVNSIVATCKFTLNKLFPTLALKLRKSMQLDQHPVSWMKRGI